MSYTFTRTGFLVTDDPRIKDAVKREYPWTVNHWSINDHGVYHLRVPIPGRRARVQKLIDGLGLEGKG